MFYNKTIETLPIGHLRKLQNERLQNLLRRVYQKVPFYKKQFDENGIRPPDIRGVEELHKLPFTKKGDLRENYPFAMFAVPMHEVKLDVEVEKKISDELSGDGFAGHDTIVLLAERLQKKIKNNIGISMKVELKEYDKIPRSTGGKLSRVKDLRLL